MLASPPERTDGKKAIAVVEDHPLMRRGLTALIDAEPDLLVCAEATTCRGALQEIARRPPDLAIVDLVLEGGDDGLDLVKALKIRHPAVPVLVFSMHPEGIYGERALRAGAQGYLTKQQVDQTVLVAIRRMLGCGIYMSEALAIDLAAISSAGKARKPPRWLCSAIESCRCFGSSATAAARGRLRKSSTSAPRRSRPTANISSRSWALAARPNCSAAPRAGSKPARPGDGGTCDPSLLA
jgi:DNA-binding NarL/FixJ family response regulator